MEGVNLTPMIRTSASAQSIRQKKQGLTPMIRTFVFVQSIHQRKMYHLLQKNDSDKVSIHLHASRTQCYILSAI